MKKLTFALLILCALNAAPAAALDKTVSVDSKVTAVPSDEPDGAMIYKVVGPGQVEYRIEAPTTDIQKLAGMLNNDPDAVIHFDGELVDKGGTKVLRVSEWRKIARSSSMGASAAAATSSAGPSGPPED